MPEKDESVGFYPLQRKYAIVQREVEGDDDDQLLACAAGDIVELVNVSVFFCGLSMYF